MATINPPVSRTVISTTDWGIPITNEINRLSGLSGRVGATRTGTQASFPINAYTQVQWQTTTETVGGVTVTPTLITVPVSGMYAIAVSILGSTANNNSYLSITVSSDRYDFNGTGSGAFVASLVVPMAAGVSAGVTLWNGSSFAFAPYAGSRWTLYKVGE